jgi:hypothetical protein
VKDGAEELKKLQELDRRAPEQVANLRAVTQGWGPDNGRWDALLAAFDWERRNHAHELAEEQRRQAHIGPCGVACGDEYCESCNVHKLIDLIDPEVSS